MKKKNNFIKNFVFFFGFAVIVLFVYVFLLTEIKSMTKSKSLKQEELIDKKNKIEMNRVELQKLTSEERIVSFAQDSLSMFRPGTEIDSVTVNKQQLMYIINKLNERYGK